MLNLMKRVFPEQVASAEWQAKLKEIIPSYDQKLAENPALLREVRLNTSRVLQLEGQEAFVRANLPGEDSPSAEQNEEQTESL